MHITAKLGIAAMVIGAIMLVVKLGQGWSTWALIAIVVALLISTEWSKSDGR